jgi:hypothetical protein
VVVFACTSCRQTLTSNLEPVGLIDRAGVGDPEEGSRIRPSTVARGFFAVDPQPFGAPFVAVEIGDSDDLPHYLPGLVTSDDRGWLMSGGPRDTVVIHPGDAPSLVKRDSEPGDHGCCGPTGENGMNMRCPCGAPVATLTAECYGYHEMHLDPVAVTPPMAER